ncbi:DUF3073 domain-containing protein [Amycolatopsis sp. NPDC005961]|uniref:DUF3073 domain-containing protein n=1 Tax=Amycolatopsis TaxID=1813 RepID=UPI0012D7C3E5|nr:DUF3073 domain-containing protein [Amycolatopsis camponoti]
MGRGRAKAKQTKVARELKYSSHETDFDALQRELSTGSSSGHYEEADSDDQDDPYDDGYGEYRR